MIRDRRTMSYIIIALIVGVALALAVALSHNVSAASTVNGQQASDMSSQTLADTAATDPAKQQPTLDQFTSKDPFLPLTVASTSGGSNSNTSADTGVSYSAKITVNGAAQTVSVGDKVPGSSPVFQISSITASDVTFKLVSGQFSDGSTAVTVSSGESVKVVDQDTNKDYTLSVTSISTAGSGGSGSNTAGHSITVASISSQNGTALVTLTVDGKTYSDLKTGDVISTAWGQIKVVSISVSQQTVVILHGDQTLTLAANQTVVK